MTPYPKYKPSGIEWLGDIPEHWEVDKIKYHADIVNGSTPKSDKVDYWDGDIIWITPEDLGNINSIEIVDSKRRITNAGLNSCGTSLTPSGSLIISTRAPIGHIAISTNVTCTNQGCKSIVIKNRFLQNYFLYYYLFIAKDELQSLGQGSTFQELQGFRLKNFKLPLPSVEEQESIKFFINHRTRLIDTLISKKQKLIDLLKEYRTAIINHAVTKGFDPNVKMKDSGIEWLGDVPDGWIITSLKRLVQTKITDGPHETPIFVDDGVPFISAEAIQNGGINFSSKRGYISKELDIQYSTKCKPKRDDIFIVKSGSTTGKIAIVDTDENFNIWSPLALVRPNSKISAWYLYYALQSSYFQCQIQTKWSFGTQPNIGMNIIENLQVAFPPMLLEQQEIVNYIITKFRSLDVQIEKEQNFIGYLKEYRTALISEVVTGKVKVTEDD